jgi:Holliday junction resolvasome RuvABC DNA-binding subunit
MISFICTSARELTIMVKSLKQSVLRELRQIPGVGKKIAEDLWNLEIRSVHDLKDNDPEALYRKLSNHKGAQVDRCMLYVLRCAVYYASNKSHDPELLKWWNWKDTR